jgi:hypothetical protein
MRNTAPPIEYLMKCSREGLQAVRLAQLNIAAERRKEIKDVEDEWVAACSLALLCEWVEKYRLQLGD